MSDYYNTLRQLQDEMLEQKTEIEKFIEWTKSQFQQIKEKQENETGLTS